MASNDPEVNLKLRYVAIVKKSLVLALALHLFVLLTYTHFEVEAYQTTKKQILIETQDIPQTQQFERPPAPARPSVPVASLSEDFPEDITIEETTLDLYEAPPPPPPPPPEEEEPEDQIEFIPYDTPPKLIKRVTPEYPEIARRAGVEGMVVLYIQVDEKGNVINAKVVKSLGNTGCDEAAITAAMKCKFRPAKQRDRAVKVWIAYPVQFKLK